MRTFEELEAIYQRTAAPPRTGGTVKLLVVRVKEGVHETPPRVLVDEREGVAGDRWATGKRDPASQITMMSSVVAEILSGRGQPPGTAGDNLFVDLDLGTATLPIGGRVRVGGAVLLEVTAKPHAGCHKFAARFGQDALRWVNWHEHRERRLRGLHCRVLAGGTVAVGDPITLA